MTNTVEIRVAVDAATGQARIRDFRRTMDGLGKTGVRAGAQLGRGFGAAREGIQSVGQQLARAKQQLVGFVSAAAAIQLGRNVAATATQMQSLRAALAGVVGSTEATADALAFVDAEVERLGLGLTVATRQFTALAAAARGTALEGRQTREIFTALSEASASLGLSNEQFAGALTAVQQIISKGTVQAEELRGQLGERLPGAFQIAARAVGVTTEELGKMLEQGELTATDFLPKFAAEIRKTFAGAVPAATRTARAEMARFGTAMTRLKEEIAASGFLDALTRGARELAEALRAPQLREAIQTLGQGFAGAVQLAVVAVRDLRGEIVLLAEALVALRLASLAQSLTAAAGGMGLLAGAARALRAALPVGVALFAVDQIVALTGAVVRGRGQLAQMRQETHELVRAQQSLVEQGRTYADLQILTEDQAQALTATELRAYRERLAASVRFHEAQRALAAREDPQSRAALDASREVRLRREALARLQPVLEAREAAEQAHGARLAAVKREETARIRASLAEQIGAYEAAQERLEQIQREREDIEAEFSEFVDRIRSGPDLGEELSFLDVAALGSKARQALAAGDLEGAIALSREAAEGLEAIQEAGDRNTLALSGMAEQIAAVAREAAAARESAAEQQVAEIQQTIDELVARAEALRFIEIGFDESGASESAVALRQRMEEILAANPIRIPVLVGGDGGNLKAAEKLLEDLPTRATGGLMRGPGTSTSDSLLARVSAGEYVLRAAAVRRYGLPFVEALNRMRLPRFAAGGAVDRLRAPASEAPAGATGTPMHLHLPGGASVGPFVAEPVVVDTLRRAISREALKSGRRVR